MRQQVRRRLFQSAFATMPLWERWETTHKADTGFRDVDGERVLVDVKREHAKAISRRLRRDMARQLARRQWYARVRTQ